MRALPSLSTLPAFMCCWAFFSGVFQCFEDAEKKKIKSSPQKCLQMYVFKELLEWNRRPVVVWWGIMCPIKTTICWFLSSVLVQIKQIKQQRALEDAVFQRLPWAKLTGCWLWLHIYRHVQEWGSSAHLFPAMWKWFCWQPQMKKKICALGFVRQRSIAVFCFCNRKTHVQQKQKKKRFKWHGAFRSGSFVCDTGLCGTLPAVTAVSNPSVFKIQYIYIDHVTAAFSSGCHLCYS